VNPIVEAFVWGMVGLWAILILTIFKIWWILKKEDAEIARVCLIFVLMALFLWLGTIVLMFCVG